MEANYHNPKDATDSYELKSNQICRIPDSISQRLGETPLRLCEEDFKKLRDWRRQSGSTSL